MGLGSRVPILKAHSNPRQPHITETLRSTAGSGSQCLLHAHSDPGLKIESIVTLVSVFTGAYWAAQVCCDCVVFKQQEVCSNDSAGRGRCILSLQNPPVSHDCIAARLKLQQPPAYSLEESVSWLLLAIFAENLPAS